MLLGIFMVMKKRYIAGGATELEIGRNQIGGEG